MDAPTKLSNAHFLPMSQPKSVNLRGEQYTHDITAKQSVAVVSIEEPVLKAPVRYVQWQHRIGGDDQLVARSRLPRLSESWAAAVLAGPGRHQNEVSRYQYHSMLGQADGAVEPSSWQLRLQQQSLDMNITLSSGRKVALQWRNESGLMTAQIQGQTHGVSVQRTSMDSQISAPLSDREQQQLSDFIKRLEGVAKQLEQGRLDFASLGLTELTDIDSLRFELRSGNGQRLVLDYQQDEHQRQLELDWNGHRLDLSVAVSRWGKTLQPEQRESSLQQYLALIESGLRQGKVSDTVRDMIRQSFSVLQQADTDALSQPSSIGFTGAVQQLMTGVADFSLQYQSVIEKPNPDPSKSHEKVSTRLQLQQLTEVNQQGSQLKLRQTQRYQLDASYYQPIDGLKAPDFGSQSYRYISLSEQSERVVEADYQQGQLQRLQVLDEHQWQQREQSYRAGELVSDEQQGDHQARLYDLTDVLRLEPLNNLELQQHQYEDALLSALVIQRPKAALQPF